MRVTINRRAKVLGVRTKQSLVTQQQTTRPIIATSAYKIGSVFSPFSATPPQKQEKEEKMETIKPINTAPYTSKPTPHLEKELCGDKGDIERNLPLIPPKEEKKTETKSEAHREPAKEKLPNTITTSETSTSAISTSPTEKKSTNCKEEETKDEGKEASTQTAKETTDENAKPLQSEQAMWFNNEDIIITDRKRIMPHIVPKEDKPMIEEFNGGQIKMLSANKLSPCNSFILYKMNKKSVLKHTGGSDVCPLKMETEHIAVISRRNATQLDKELDIKLSERESDYILIKAFSGTVRIRHARIKNSEELRCELTGIPHDTKPCGFALVRDKAALSSTHTSSASPVQQTLSGT